jgi:hypothetical protein
MVRTEPYLVNLRQPAAYAYLTTVAGKPPAEKWVFRDPRLEKGNRARAQILRGCEKLLKNSLGTIVLAKIFELFSVALNVTLECACLPLGSIKRWRTRKDIPVSLNLPLPMMEWISN